MISLDHFLSIHSGYHVITINIFIEINLNEGIGICSLIGLWRLS